MPRYYLNVKKVSTVHIMSVKANKIYLPWFSFFDPLGRPKFQTGSNHYFRTFQNIAKRRLKKLIATGRTVGLVERIIDDDTCLVVPWNAAVSSVVKVCILLERNGFLPVFYWFSKIGVLPVSYTGFQNLVCLHFRKLTTFHIPEKICSTSKITQ